ncbi:hypothetical protein CTheo_8714 [Ceratobasidium theobromae]|uniref:DUF659 domain-containing protein n=1 Tax=Ceratobasidium theobromae TaxID=1582974 RepID=A0A5N5Q842_9AGAM|nr:hypothetical protein CTheo_8714 [Ceratobasidium theobromae]
MLAGTTQKPRMIDTDGIVRVLPPSEVKLLLTELEALLAALPSSLPVVVASESRYSALIGFTPDLELVEDIGEVGAVNTALERMFGHRKDGLKIFECGKSIESIVSVLEKYLKRYPGDIILQKWLIDLVTSARSFCSRRIIKQTEKAREADLKRKCPDMSDNSITIDSEDEDEEAGDFTDISDDEANSIPSSPPQRQPNSHRPAARRSLGKPFSVRKKQKLKKIAKPAQSYDAIPDKHDPRFDDEVYALATMVSHGGAPHNELADRLVISCYLKDKPKTDKNHHFWCVASSLCGFKLANTKRQLDQILRHSVRCPILCYWKPELYAQAEVEYAQHAPSAKLAPEALGPNQEGTTVSAPTMLPVPAEQHASAVKRFFAPFADQAKLDTITRINLAVVRLLCSAGMPPRIADSPDWTRLFHAIAPRLLGYTPPSSTTLCDKLIPAEARQALLNMRHFLAGYHNLSLSIDGLTEGDQPVYTVHICTPDRHSFLLRGDVYFGSHTSAYVTELLDRVIEEIGIERIASVVSDDASVMKKARRDLVAKYPTIINLTNPCHKLNLCIQDICSDKMFNEVIESMRVILTHFNHSTQATGKLNVNRRLLNISNGLKSIGKTRFATLKISAQSLIDCMPALYMMNNDGDLAYAPEEVQRVTCGSSISAMKFLFGLKKLVSAIDPLARALLCLESSHSTIGDNHIYWLAAMSMLEELFQTPDGAFTESEISRLRVKITCRFEETINEPPNDVYILGSFGDPRMRNKRIYHKLNPLAVLLILPAPQGAPRTANSSPCSHLSDSVWSRIRRVSISILKAELMLAERLPSHPLTNYDAQRAKNELDSLLVQYASSLYPFDQPLGNQTVLEYWNMFYMRPDTKILAFVFMKLFSVIPNSMNDERTGSRMTFLYSKLRSRMDVTSGICKSSLQPAVAG